jgi:hypothetical protein
VDFALLAKGRYLEVIIASHKSLINTLNSRSSRTDPQEHQFILQKVKKESRKMVLRLLVG